MQGLPAEAIAGFIFTPMPGDKSPVNTLGIAGSIP
jgi:hypothetical protein